MGGILTGSINGLTPSGLISFGTDIILEKQGFMQVNI
jgi:hypothetical protein